VATEQTFLQENGVTVTHARFIVASQTYAMSGITSVAAGERKPSRVWPVTLIVIGVIAFMFGSPGAAVICVAAGGVWWYLQKTEYAVLLRTASGEAEALTSKDKGYVTRIVAALNNAIVARG
jgi:hypothetical protein